MDAAQPPLRAATPADAEEIADILSEAFDDDPVLNWVLRDRRPIRTLFREMAGGLYLRRGFGHLDGDAATLWTPPGIEPDPPFWNWLKVVGATGWHGGPRSLARAARAGETLAANHPDTPHYYLFAVGVRPGRQGAGLGGRAIRAGLDRADAEGAAAYLENSKPRNTPLYQRVGFEALDEIRFGPDAPPLLRMLRRGREAA